MSKISIFHITTHSSSYSDLVDGRIITNFHKCIFHIYISITIFLSQQTGLLIGIGRSETNLYLWSQSLLFMEKLFMLTTIEFLLLWIFIIVIKFTIIGVDIADGRQWLRSNARRIIANDCLEFIYGRPLSKVIAYLWACHRTGVHIAYLTPIIASIGHELQ